MRIPHLKTRLVVAVLASLAIGSCGGGADTGVERRVPPLLALEQIPQRHGKRGRLLFDHHTRVVGRLVVDDQELPVADHVQFGDAADRLTQFIGAIVSRDDD